MSRQHDGLMALSSGLRHNGEVPISYSALVETVTDPILTLTHEYKIIQWNSAAESVFGYSAIEARGSFFFDLAVGVGGAAILRNEIESLNGSCEEMKIGRQLEIMGKTKNGDSIPLEV